MVKQIMLLRVAIDKQTVYKHHTKAEIYQTIQQSIKLSTTLLLLQNYTLKQAWYRTYELSNNHDNTTFSHFLSRLLLSNNSLFATIDTASKHGIILF